MSPIFWTMFWKTTLVTNAKFVAFWDANPDRKRPKHFVAVAQVAFDSGSYGVAYLFNPLVFMLFSASWSPLNHSK